MPAVGFKSLCHDQLPLPASPTPLLAKAGGSSLLPSAPPSLWMRSRAAGSETMTQVLGAYAELWRSGCAASPGLHSQRAERALRQGTHGALPIFIPGSRVNALQRAIGHDVGKGTFFHPLRTPQPRPYPKKGSLRTRRSGEEPQTRF